LSVQNAPAVVKGTCSLSEGRLVSPATPTQNARPVPPLLRAQIGPDLAARLDALPDHQRETLARLCGLRNWQGQRRKSTTRVRLAVGLLAVAARDAGQDDGRFLLNVSRLARELHLSRTTLYDSLSPLISPMHNGEPKLLRVSSTKKPRGSPSWWILRRSLWQEDSLSSKPVNSDSRVRGEPPGSPEGPPTGETSPQSGGAALLGERPPASAKGRGRTPSSCGEPDKAARLEGFTRWLGNLQDCELARVPADTEKAKLCGAIRRLVKKGVADGVTSALYARKGLPLRIWRDAVGALWNGARPTSANREELRKRGFVAVAGLAKDGNRTLFLEILEIGQPRAERARFIAARRLAGLEVWKEGAETKTPRQLSWARRQVHTLELIVGAPPEDAPLPDVTRAQWGVLKAVHDLTASSGKYAPKKQIAERSGIDEEWLVDSWLLKDLVKAGLLEKEAWQGFHWDLEEEPPDRRGYRVTALGITVLDRVPCPAPADAAAKAKAQQEAHLRFLARKYGDGLTVTEEKPTVAPIATAPERPKAIPQARPVEESPELKMRLDLIRHPLSMEDHAVIYAMHLLDDAAEETVIFARADIENDGAILFDLRDRGLLAHAEGKQRWALTPFGQEQGRILARCFAPRQVEEDVTKEDDVEEDDEDDEENGW